MDIWTNKNNNYNHIDWLIRNSLLSAPGTLDVCCIRSDEGLTRLRNDESRRKHANEGQYCGFCLPPIKSMKLNLLIWRWKRGNISNSHRKGNKPQCEVSILWMRKIWLESLISSPFNCKIQFHSKYCQA